MCILEHILNGTVPTAKGVLVIVRLRESEISVPGLLAGHA